MALLIAYLAVNMIISVILEKSKVRFRIATVVHAVTFTVVLVLLAMAIEDGYIPQMMRRILGSYYAPMHEVCAYSGEKMLGPLAVIEMLIPLLFIAIGAYYTAKVVKYVRTRRAPFVRRAALKKLPSNGVINAVCVNRIYLLNCVIRC